MLHDPIMELAFIDEQLLLEMHPSIKNAFDSGSHPLSKHPVFQKHGKGMSDDQYAHLKSQYQSRTGKQHLDPNDMMRAFQLITQVEHAHAHQLQQLAIDIVTKVWKISPQLIGQAEITNNIDIDTEKHKDEPEDLTPEQMEQVEKRITMNMLTHGSAIHMMTTMYHLAKEALDKIDNRLVPLYDRFSTGAVLSSWYQDIEALLKLMGVQKGGSEQVQWNDDKPQIVAKAIMFPLLLHELSKGVMEVLTMHQLSSLDPDTLKKVYKHADKYEHEFFHFFVGPAVWRKFLKVVPQDKLPRVVAALTGLKSKDVTAFIDAVVSDPEMATQMINNLVRDPEGTVDSL